MRYDETEIARIARVGFETARTRKGKLLSVDKANVLGDLSVVARRRDRSVGRLSGRRAQPHVRRQRGDAAGARTRASSTSIVTGNLFGDILSDEASMCAGSIGMLPSAALERLRTRACTSRFMAARPTLPGKARPTPVRGDPVRGDDAASFARPARRRRPDRGCGRGCDPGKGARTPDLGGTLSTSRDGRRRARIELG